MKKHVYIIHGWAYEVEKWQPFMHELRAEKDLELHFLHVPGLTTEPLKKAWTIDDYVQWLDDAIKHDNSIIIGHSNGGRIALNYALKHPEKLAKLILIDSAGIRPRGAKSAVKRTVLKTIAKTGKVFTASPKARKLLYRLARERDYYNADLVMRETMAHLLQSDRQLNVRQVGVPTLLIWGKNDKATPLNQAKVMKKRIPGARLEIINGARHSPQFTHTKEVVKIVIRELRK